MGEKAQSVKDLIPTILEDAAMLKKELDLYHPENEEDSEIDR